MGVNGQRAVSIYGAVDKNEPQDAAQVCPHCSDVEAELPEHRLLHRVRDKGVLLSNAIVGSQSFLLPFQVTAAPQDWAPQGSL